MTKARKVALPSVGMTLRTLHLVVVPRQKLDGLNTQSPPQEKPHGFGGRKLTPCIGRPRVLVGAHSSATCLLTIFGFYKKQYHWHVCVSKSWVGSGM